MDGKVSEVFDDFSFASRLSFGRGVRPVVSRGAFCGAVRHGAFSYEIDAP